MPPPNEKAWVQGPGCHHLLVGKGSAEGPFTYKLVKARVRGQGSLRTKAQCEFTACLESRLESQCAGSCTCLCPLFFVFFTEANSPNVL